MDHQTWRKDGKCVPLDSREVDTIFDIGRGQKSNNAKLFCADCSVRAQCLVFAVVHDEQGIWAGYTKPERDTLRSYSIGNSVGVFKESRNSSDWLPQAIFSATNQIQPEDYQDRYSLDSVVEPLQFLIPQQVALELSQQSVADALVLAEALLAAP